MEPSSYYVALRYLEAATPADGCIAGPAIVASSEELWNDVIGPHLEEFCRKRAAGGEALSFGNALPRLNESYVYEVEQSIAGLSGLDTAALSSELFLEQTDERALRKLARYIRHLELANGFAVTTRQMRVAGHDEAAFEELMAPFATAIDECQKSCAQIIKLGDEGG